VSTRPAPSLSTATSIVTCGALIATALMPLLRQDHALPVVTGLATALVVSKVPAVARYVTGPQWSPRAVIRGITQLALYLSPVALLTLVYPIASHRIGNTRVDGVNLTALLLASSLTVPWLGQAVCLPLYRAIGHLISARDMDKIQDRFCQVWPTTFVQCLPAIALFAVPVELATRWPVRALLAYITLCLLHTAFAQSLVLANVGRRRVLWALAWLSYSAALFIIPTAWFLPPLVGLLTQLIAMRKHLPRMAHLAILDRTTVALDLVRGLLLGAVLWSDKFFLYLRSGTHFAVTMVFLALLPAVLAYNYFFVRLAPTFDLSVEKLRTAMESETYRQLSERSNALSDTVETGVGKTGLIGACLCLTVTFIITLVRPGFVQVTAAITVAAWLFMMITVVCYKLDYIGKSVQAQAFSAAHLVGCAAAFVFLPLGPGLYAALSGFEALVFVTALYTCLTQWQSSEYTLFWRHATAW
jgi:hypothetical protein